MGRNASGSNTPIHRELLLIVGLDWAILWETLDNFYGAVELGVDKLVRVHGPDEGFWGGGEMLESIDSRPSLLTAGWRRSGLPTR